MLEAVTTDLVFTISLKRSTKDLQLSTSRAGRLHHLWGRQAAARRLLAFDPCFRMSGATAIFLIQSPEYREKFLGALRTADLPE